jgi:hypothetical protein
MRLRSPSGVSLRRIVAGLFVLVEVRHANRYSIAIGCQVDYV